MTDDQELRIAAADAAETVVKLNGAEFLCPYCGTWEYYVPIADSDEVMCLNCCHAIDWEFPVLEWRNTGNQAF